MSDFKAEMQQIRFPLGLPQTPPEDSRMVKNEKVDRNEKVISSLSNLKSHFLSHSPVALLMSSPFIRSVTDWSVNWSIRSTSHWRCDSSLMAAYSCTKAQGFSDACSMVSRSVTADEGHPWTSVEFSYRRCR